MATKLRLLQSSLAAVMANIVMLDPMIHGIESKLVWMTLNLRSRRDRVRYWLTGYFGRPKSKPRAYKGHMS